MNRGDLVLTSDGYQGIILHLNQDYAEVFTGNGLSQGYALRELTPVPFAKDSPTANFAEILWRIRLPEFPYKIQRLKEEVWMSEARSFAKCESAETEARRLSTLSPNKFRVVDKSGGIWKVFQNGAIES